jgi:hypothetical protein
MLSRIRALRMLVMGSGIAVMASASASATASASTDPEEAGLAAPEEAGLAAPEEANLLAMPSPLSLVSGLDLECFATPGPALNVGVTLSHLNPVLQSLGLPAHNVVLRELQQTCMPVSKNAVVPPSPALDFIRHIDLACYRIDAAPLANPVPLSLTHQNPVFANLPLHYVSLIKPTQLCVPVMKNGIAPPAGVIDLVRYVDLECYAADPITAHPNFAAFLQQLNPQLTGIAGHGMSLGSANRQLCVPVRKNNQAIPAASLDIIKWIDLEKFQASAPVSIAPKYTVLGHLNPLFSTLPRVGVTLQTADSLMVPVAKNNQQPPP